MQKFKLNKKTVLVLIIGLGVSTQVLFPKKSWSRARIPSYSARVEPVAFVPFLEEQLPPPPDEWLELSPQNSFDVDDLPPPPPELLLSRQSSISAGTPAGSVSSANPLPPSVHGQNYSAPASTLLNLPFPPSGGVDLSPQNSVDLNNLPPPPPELLVSPQSSSEAVEGAGSENVSPVSASSEPLSVSGSSSAENVRENQIESRVLDQNDEDTEEELNEEEHEE